jgi:arginine decarboxylase
VLVVEVFGTIERTKDKFVAAQPDDHKLVIQLSDLIQNLNKRNRTESLHDGLQIKEDAFTRFELGLLDLPTRAKIETNFWHLAEKISKMYAGVKNIPNEVEELNKLLGDQYLCNFSVFQSMVDHWAIGQTFPIIPIHRLNEAPSNEGTLVDITCDSDGKVDDYISCEGLKQSMMLHPFNPDEPYYMGIFLVGAYQDVMGDLHNLFGAVNEAHIFIDEDEEDDFYIEETIKGYSIAEALSDVQYEPSQLARQMKAQVDLAIKQDRLKPNEAMKLLDYYEKGLQKPTYLSWDE